MLLRACCVLGGAAVGGVSPAAVSFASRLEPVQVMDEMVVCCKVELVSGDIVTVTAYEPGAGYIGVDIAGCKEQIVSYDELVLEETSQITAPTARANGSFIFR